MQLQGRKMVFSMGDWCNVQLASPEDDSLKRECFLYKMRASVLARVLFQEANWLITAQEKTALVGANGTGKSTLMQKVLGRAMEMRGGLDYGEMQRTRGHVHRLSAAGGVAAERSVGL